MLDGKDYQLIIIGGGPAGLTAGIYAAREGLKTLIVERMCPGGKMMDAELLENYPGFPEGIPGSELGALMQEQAMNHGINLVMDEITGIELRGNKKILSTSSEKLSTDTVIIAGGTEHAKLGIPGETEMVGRGLSYCAICDGPLFKDKVVAVVGGGNTAVSEALSLAKFTSKVIVIHRRDQLRADKILQERAFKEPKIEFIWDSGVEAINGPDMVSGLQLRNKKTAEESTLSVEGVFMAVGVKPNSDYLSQILKLGPTGAIPVSSQMETEVAGIFAAGDIREGSVKQVIAATGDGAIAAITAESYVSRNK